MFSAQGSMNRKDISKYGPKPRRKKKPYCSWDQQKRKEKGVTAVKDSDSESGRTEGGKKLLPEEG